MYYSSFKVLVAFDCMSGLFDFTPLSHVLKVNHLIEEGLVEGLSTQGTAEQLNIEATLLEGRMQLVCNDCPVFVQAFLAFHLFLEHASKQFCGLVWLWKGHTAN